MSSYPILAVTGPRQSGKTTLLEELFPNYRYVSLENTDNRTFAEQDPNGFLKLYDHKVIFDEAQRVPTLFSYLQTLGMRNK
ncbi:MAG: AAA family ATPase [Bacteroidota bacterium]